ncbi:hypothetical protein ISF_09701 [Cordyceps fumosorosea ARSEF 2679]|uniref:Uncharacterized protein n=1 Tax=Cordyceps fumosorosea (strain ARSEF 2679) TaxID=1081104 RepID=A0A162HST1_CORFA|nr:hypothetical protein ISF_09701 [Cordyceps fumosorosea ARSEF 2679]OAA42785.1 hypothetical protein ISF_09701 [Cordyceps fumosorosea ARSEF 2679]
MMASKLIPVRVLASGAVGTGGLGAAQDAEGTDEGKVVTRELFAGHRGVPEGPDARGTVLKLQSAGGETVVRFAGLFKSRREGWPGEEADRTPAKHGQKD